MKALILLSTLALTGCGMVMEDDARWSYCFAACTFNFASPEGSGGSIGDPPPLPLDPEQIAE